jgi:hypothetical protein
MEKSELSQPYQWVLGIDVSKESIDMKLDLYKYESAVILFGKPYLKQTH